MIIINNIYLLSQMTKCHLLLLLLLENLNHYNFKMLLLLLLLLLFIIIFIIITMIICDPLCENPAKVIFCDSLFAVFYKKIILHMVKNIL